jgi:hypothetical protein
MSSDFSARHTTIPQVGQRLGTDWSRPAIVQLRRQIHRLAEDLMRDILGAITESSAAEIGELIRTGALVSAPLVPNRPRRTAPHSAPMQTNAAERTAPSDASNRRQGTLRERVNESGREARSQVASHDPFDITSPSELLASTHETRRTVSAFGPLFDGTPPRIDSAGTKATDASSGLDAAPKAADAPSLDPNGSLPAAGESVGALPAGDREAESERRPKIVLREGERLLSSTGSGVVIRRERRISPQR